MDKVLTVDLNVASAVNPIQMSVIDESDPIKLTVESGGGGGRLPSYRGAYEVTPRKVEQVLETKNKSMLDDVTVYKIFYAEVGNVSGGYTATIGNE